jgi:hypothetical protein
MEGSLQGLEKTIATGRLKDRNKMERRLGRIQAQHPQVNELYDVELCQTAEGIQEVRATTSRAIRRCSGNLILIQPPRSQCLNLTDNLHDASGPRHFCAASPLAASTL